MRTLTACVLGVLLVILPIACGGPEEPTGPGALVVTSTPNGAGVFLNGGDTGQLTPATITHLSPGNYLVTLKRRNYEDWERRVTVPAARLVTVDAALHPKCPGEVIGDLAQPPRIEIVDLHPGDDYVSGRADNLDARVLRSVHFGYTDGWYVQPYTDSPYTPVCGDGSWKTYTHPWTRFVSLLVDSTYQVDFFRHEHPATARGVVAWDEFPGPSQDRIIDFSGFRWRIKVGGPIGPGDNIFDPRNVWIDEAGQLHLKTELRGNQWTSGEVIGERALGYGVYTVQFVGRLDDLDFHAVKAFFLYLSDALEIDFEASQELAQPQNSQFVVQPSSIERFTLPPTDALTVRIDWQATRIVFSCWRGFADEPTSGTLIRTWTYAGSVTGHLQPRFNVWLYRHQTPGRADELIVRSFRFQPAV